MIIYPAIDIIQGKCVRLLKGDFETSKVYNDNPIEVAQGFKDSGAEWLHMIDLDGAKSPEKRQVDIIKNIVAKTDLKIQVGGGIRTEDDVAALLDSGVERVIIGSLAVKNFALTEKILEKFGPGKIVLAMDVMPHATSYHIVVSGWQEDSQFNLFELLSNYHEIGLKHVLCTDVARDGALKGINVKLYKSLKENFSTLDIQASGGVRGMEDVLYAKPYAKGIIIGKALYEGFLKLEDALAC